MARNLDETPIFLSEVVSYNCTWSCSEMLLFGELIGCCSGNERGEFATDNGRIYKNPVLASRNHPSNVLHNVPPTQESRFYLGPRSATESMQEDLDSIAYGSTYQYSTDRPEVQIASFDQLESLRLGEPQLEQQQYQQSFRKRPPPHLIAKRQPETKPIKLQPTMAASKIYTVEEKENLKSRKEVLSWQDSCESALSYWQHQPDQTPSQSPRSYFPLKSPRNPMPRSKCL